MRIEIGSRIKILVGPHKGESGKVLDIEFGTGAINGWFMIELENGMSVLFAGEEIDKLRDGK